MELDALKNLNGRSVLVVSGDSADRNPQTGVRGSVRVTGRSDGTDELRVEIVVDLPDMKNRPATQHIIPLSDDDVRRLLNSDVSGTYEYRIPGHLPA